MTRAEVKQGLMILTDFDLISTPDFSDPNKAKRRLDSWYMFLQNYEYKQFEIAIMIYIKNNRYFPTIADILKEFPVPTGYIQPERIYHIYMNGKPTDLIRKAFSECGYSKFYLQQLDPKTIEINVKPRVERVYRELMKLD